jgi:hypothetical protein
MPQHWAAVTLLGVFPREVCHFVFFCKFLAAGMKRKSQEVMRFTAESKTKQNKTKPRKETKHTNLFLRRNTTTVSIERSKIFLLLVSRK